MMSAVPKMTAAPATPARHGILRLLKAYFSANRVGDLLVLQGRLTPDALDECLALARTRGHRLGQVLLDEGLIRRHELYATLGTQWSVRTLAYTSAAVVSFMSFTPRAARADDGRVPMAVAMLHNVAYMPATSFVIPPAPTHKVIRHAAVFGAGEKMSQDLSAFTKWTAMFDRLGREQAGPAIRAQLVSLQGQIQAQKSHSTADLVRMVDQTFNQVQYVDDKDNYQKSDYWATPYEFLSRGGDCEDYAIAKYMALKSLGLRDDQMRIAIVHDLVKKIPHAILIVNTADGALVLDNQSKDTKRMDEITRYKPIFSINQTAWWLHTPETGSVQVATAAR